MHASPTTDDGAETLLTDPVQTIVGAVAAATDEDPLTMDPLYDSLDPDALEALLESGDETLSVRFEYGGCDVVVTPDAVTVDA